MEQKLGNDRLFNKAFLMICLASLLAHAGNQIVCAILPLYLNSLHFAPSVLGTASSLSALGAMLFRPVSGTLSDRKSKYLTAGIGIALMLLGMLGLPVFPFAAAVIVIRILQGAGISAITTAQTAIATDVLPTAHVKKGLSYFGVGNTLANALGPAVGMALIIGANFTPAWLGGSALLLGAMVLTVIMSRYGTKPVGAAEKLSLKSGFEKTALLPGLVYLILQIPNATLMFVPTYGLELGLDNVAFYYTLQAFAMLAGNIIVGKLVDRVKRPVVLLYPCLLFFCGYCAALYLAQEAVLFYSAAVLYGLGFGGACAVISVVVMSIAAPEKRGAASATYLCAGDLGYCIGSFLWGQTSTVFGYRWSFGAAILLSVFTVVFSLLLLRRKTAPETK